MHLRQSRGIADIQRKWCISIWLALFVATVATDGAVFVATLPVSQFFYFFSLAAPLAQMYGCIDICLSTPPFRHASDCQASELMLSSKGKMI